MEREHAPRPTGRRKITLPQIAAEAARAAPSITARTATTPGRVLAAFKRASPALGASCRMVNFIDTLMSHSHPQDWDGGLGPLVWPSDEELEERLQLRPTQRKAIVRAALDAGLIRMRRSSTGRRWGHRDRPPGEGGRIAQAYGFDLAPLGERMAEFERLAAEWDARREEGKQLRREVACLRAEILALVELATGQGYGGEDWPGFAAQADALMRARGSHRDPLALMPIVARLRALHMRVRELVEAVAAAALAAKLIPAPVPPAAAAAVEDGETDPAGPEYRLPITTTKQLVSVGTTVAPGAAGPDRPKAHKAQSDQVRSSPREASRQAERGESAKPAPTSALRGFVLTPEDVLRMAPAFRAWVASASPSWHELAEAAFYVCGELGISKHAWGQACVVLGRMGAVGALAVVATRHAAGKVRSPGGLLRKMVELHQRGELWLDKSLFGLTARSRMPAEPSQPGTRTRKETFVARPKRHCGTAGG
jgi:replication initiation protein RepC